jgi:HSP20 family protein
MNQSFMEVNQMIRRWDPFREMMVLRNSLDRVVDRDMALAPGDWKAFNWSVALDVVESEDEYLVKASLPGINPEDLDITFDDNRLTIKGEVKEESDVEDSHYHLRERRYGSFTRSIKMPSGIQSDEIEARYDKGVLELHLPKVEEIKPKKITIQASTPEIIDAESVSKN